jgi:hypothetical protein
VFGFEGLSEEEAIDHWKPGCCPLGPGMILMEGEVMDSQFRQVIKGLHRKAIRLTERERESEKREAEEQRNEEMSRRRREAETEAKAKAKAKAEVELSGNESKSEAKEEVLVRYQQVGMKTLPPWRPRYPGPVYRRKRGWLSPSWRTVPMIIPDVDTDTDAEAGAGEEAEAETGAEACISTG